MTDNKKKTHLIVTGRGGGGSGEQVQADWSQTDDTQVDYIKNKPSLATVATSGDYDDLTNKPTIPAAPVQSDWNEADSSSLAYINNKPTIPPQQWFGTQAEYDLIDPKDPNVIYNIEGSDNVQADWNQNDSSADDYIKNKPTIPAVQVNSDWNAVSGVAQILNKPTIPTVPAMATETLTFTLQGGTVKTVEFYTVPNYFYVEDISGVDNTLTIKNDMNNNPIEVFKSTDRTNWISMGTTNSTGITATIPANGKLYLKATVNKWGDSTNSGANIITATGNHNVGGNIMSLLYGDNFVNQTTFPTNSSKNFGSLFNGNKKLVNANKLELPVTTLTQTCYHSMFKDCSALTTTPALPATTLANGCYVSMFMYCTSLTTAPVLPATVVTREGYAQIFKGCTSLNSITTYAQDISTYDCLYEWLDNVAATGDFYNLGGATFPSSASGIPSGWTEHTSL